MKHTPENPFASPEILQSQKPRPSVYGGLIPLWIWLGMTSFLPIVVKLSDPISNILLLLANLLPLWIGWGLATTKSRILQVTLWLIVIVATAWLCTYFPSFVAAGGPFYVLLNVLLAAFAAWRLGERRLNVITSFSIGFVLGTPLICYGTMIGGVVASLLAVRSTGPRAEIADDTAGEPPR